MSTNTKIALAAILLFVVLSGRGRKLPRQKRLTTKQVIDKVQGYHQLIVDSLQGSLAKGVPSDWMIPWVKATIDHESDGFPHATSYKMSGVANHSGEYLLDANGQKIPLAKGLGQFLDSTSKQFSVKDPYNPADIIPGMVRLLSYLYLKKEGDLARIANSYYAGAAGKMPEQTKSPEASKDKQSYIDTQIMLYNTYKAL